MWRSTVIPGCSLTAWGCSFELLSVLDSYVSIGMYTAFIFSGAAHIAFILSGDAHIAFILSGDAHIVGDLEVSARNKI